MTASLSPGKSSDLRPRWWRSRTAGLSQEQTVRTPPRTPHASARSPPYLPEKEFVQFLVRQPDHHLPAGTQGPVHRASEPLCTLPLPLSAPRSHPCCSSRPPPRPSAPPPLRGSSDLLPLGGSSLPPAGRTGHTGVGCSGGGEQSLASSQVNGESGRGIAWSLSIPPAPHASSLTLRSPNSLSHNIWRPNPSKQELRGEEVQRSKVSDTRQGAGGETPPCRPPSSPRALPHYEETPAGQG